MRNEIVSMMRQECKRKQKKREYILYLLKIIDDLETDEKVKRYIDLKAELANINYEKIINESDEQILYNTFYNYQHMINEPLDIYVCLGTFMMGNAGTFEQGLHEIRVESDDPRAGFRIYKNIENNYSFQISISRCEEFENAHTVIFPKSDISADEYFCELQKEYINALFVHGKKKASQRILCNKYR